MTNPYEAPGAETERQGRAHRLSAGARILYATAFGVGGLSLLLSAALTWFLVTAD